MSEMNEMVPEQNNEAEMPESNDSESSGGVGSAISGLVGLGTGIFGGLKIGKSREKARVLEKIHEVVDDESYKVIEAAVNAKPEKKKKEKKGKLRMRSMFYREPISNNSEPKPDNANGEVKKEDETSGEAK